MRFHEVFCRVCWLFVGVVFLAGCSTPIGIRHVSPSEAYRAGLANPLTAGVTSNEANVVLQRFDLQDEFAKNPARVISFLHDKALHDDRRDILYALAELSYLYAGKLQKKFDSSDPAEASDYYLLASIYAYFFLLDERVEPPPNAFDPRARTACDLYNFGLWQGMATGKGGALDFAAARRVLPIGSLAITPDLSKFPWALESFDRFEPVDTIAIRGVSIRNRTNGIGSMLVGVKKADQGVSFDQTVPVTIFLRIEGTLAQVTEGKASASLEFYSAYEDNQLEIKGRRPPLATDSTTPVAYALESSKVWNFGIGAFFGEEFQSVPNGLYLSQPYQAGRIPVVFVHGTFSNPAWWVEMLNTLRADPILRQKFQFWYFMYKSNAPVLTSAADLRDAIEDKIEELDPSGSDHALREMVVVGHSQGGLLTKLAAVDTGDSLVRALTGKDFDELALTGEKKDVAERYLMVKPVPAVKRVVFIATPHHGSILSKNFVRLLFKKLVTLPERIIRTTLTLHEYLTDRVKLMIGSGKVPTSIDGMSPDNPVLKTLAATPLAGGVVGHSIIAIDGDEVPPEGDDGVVAYASAHLDGMESEFIVRSGHSCQDHPFTIEEMRRILLKHLGPLAEPVR